MTTTSPPSSITRTRSWSATRATDATDIGPMVSAPQREKVAAQVEAAVAAGAEVLTGGDRAGHERGHFFAPTVVTGLPAETDLLREETFGPVAPIVPVKSLDEAIELANGTQFGLGANIYTRDLRNILRCMREIKAGTVWFNDPLTDNDAGPFGGFKQSGLGRELGREGPRSVPGDQARPHRDRARDQGLVVPLRPRRQVAGRRRGRLGAAPERRSATAMATTQRRSPNFTQRSEPLLDVSARHDSSQSEACPKPLKPAPFVISSAAAGSTHRPPSRSTT